MKILTYFSSTIFILLSFQLFSQNDRVHSPSLTDAEVAVLLDQFESLKKDTTYFQSIIPKKIETGTALLNNQHFAYPVIFVHGLTGSADSWMAMTQELLTKGWSFGNRLDFSLNSDGNIWRNNIYGNNPDFKDFNNPLDLRPGDFYTINFNVTINGQDLGEENEDPMQSNQAAIYKQGMALKYAIQHVLNITGKNKVVLFGHSMGGLAIRQYIQNQNFWQADGKHHVAKVITTGTPHGGSNVTFPSISGFLGVDELSDAVRDLRTSYYYSDEKGVFLFGGKEDPGIMDDNSSGFYNYDVNCNDLEGNSITGLNNKIFPQNIDLSCIISNWTGLGSDGVVYTSSAQLKNYININSESFHSIRIHTKLPNDLERNFLALDEPDDYHLAYEVNTNELINGYFSEQAIDGKYVPDYDDYIFTIQEKGKLKIKVDNLYPSKVNIYVFDASTGNQIYQEEITSDPFTSPRIPLNPGQYYFELQATPDENSWIYPYNFRLGFEPDIIVGISKNTNFTEFELSPNPASSIFSINQKEPSFSQPFTISIFDINGIEVLRKSVFSNPNIDISEFNSGIYIVKIEAGDKFELIKLIKN